MAARPMKSLIRVVGSMCIRRCLPCSWRLCTSCLRRIKLWSGFSSLCFFAGGCIYEAVRTLAYLRGNDHHLARHYTAWYPWLGVAAVFAAALPALNCLQRGQVTIVVLYLLLLGLRLSISGRTHQARIAGGIVLALTVAIKFIPLLPVLFLLYIQLVGFLRKRWQRQTTVAPLARQLAASTLGVGLGLFLFFLLVPAALIGWNANLRHIDTWAHLVLSSAEKSTATPGFEKDTHSVRNQCLGNALYRLGNFGAYLLAGGPEDPLVDDSNPPPRMMDSPSVDKCLLFVRITLLLAMLLVGVRLGIHHQTALSQAAGFGLACTALLVVSPVARNHYFLLLAPAVLFLPLWLDCLGSSRWAAVLVRRAVRADQSAVPFPPLCRTRGSFGTGYDHLALGRLSPDLSQEH